MGKGPAAHRSYRAPVGNILVGTEVLTPTTGTTQITGSFELIASYIPRPPE